MFLVFYTFTSFTNQSGMVFFIFRVFQPYFGFFPLGLYTLLLHELLVFVTCLFLWSWGDSFFSQPSFHWFSLVWVFMALLCFFVFSATIFRFLSINRKYSWKAKHRDLSVSKFCHFEQLHIILGILLFCFKYFHKTLEI